MPKKIKITLISESTFTVQGHGVHSAFVEMHAALDARPDTDVIITKFRRGADITHIHTFGPYSLAHLLFGPGKKVISVHVVPDSLIGSIKAAEKFIGSARRYMRFFYGRGDLLLAVSNTVAGILHDELKVTRPVEVLYNTVDAAAYATPSADVQDLRRELDVPLGKKIIVSCGQIQPRKRFDVFCDVARQLPEAEFVWVGGTPFKQLGDDYESLRRMVRKAPGNVRVTGVVAHAQVKRYLQAADIFFLPSDQENHPMAVLEAAATGLPIVLRDLREYDDTFDGDALRGDDTTFAAIIRRLLDDEAFYKQAVAGCRRIAARFDSAAGADRIVEGYHSLLAPTPK